MKAIIFDKYGPPEVLQLVEVEKPTPQDNEVLIKVHAAGVTLYDCWNRSCTSPPGFNLLMRIASGRVPKKPILGTDLSGKIAAVGKDVTRLKKGDPVYAFTGMKFGAHAEYICLPEEAVALKPGNATYEEASAILYGALTAWYFIREANLQPGQKVLIVGASGGVGGYAVQLAKHYLKAHVTGVCSTAKMAYVRSLGADQIIDYTQEDFTKNGKCYDVVFDTMGKTSVSRTRKSLNPNGWYLLATFGLPTFIQLMWFSWRSNLNWEYGLLAETTEDLQFIKDLVETSVIKPSLDRVFSFEQAAEAHRYVESGQKMGNVAITIARQ
ncbi:MAG: NAD(P)-dependent alcohol dehydrogenase [Anaerolineaceae bacterium]|nr:NAD(P)-dependent alcohol dehydrogenase [Anaerolineaceae bacterium]